MQFQPSVGDESGCCSGHNVRSCQIPHGCADDQGVGSFVYILTLILTLTLTLMVKVLGASCTSRDIFYEVTALECRKEQLNYPGTAGYDLSISTLFRIFRSAIAMGIDAELLQALFGFFGRMLHNCDRIEMDSVAERENNMKALHPISKDAIETHAHFSRPLNERYFYQIDDSKRCLPSYTNLNPNPRFN